jgi:PAS domain S-box-containing protein
MTGLGSKPAQVEMRDLCSSIADASPMPMAGVEGDGHVIRYVNSAFCVLVRKPEDVLIGAPFSSTVPMGDECLSLLDRVHCTGHAETHTGRDDSAANRFYWSYFMWPILADDKTRVGIVIQVTETTPFHEHATALNQALVIGSVRQHELIEGAGLLNAQLQAEITHRKHVECAMKVQQLEIEASEKRYRGLIEAIPQIVWTATADGILDFANSKWFEYLGFNAGAYRPTQWSALLYPDDKERFLERWSEGLRSESAFQIEHRLINGSIGRYRWYLSRAVPIRLENGSVVEWLGTSTDVDDQKRDEQAMYQKQKLESLGILAGGLAHDFNNLLVGVLGGASYAASVLPATDPLQVILAGIASAGERAAHLTRQMLAYAGKGRFLIEQIDVGELVLSTRDLIQTSVPKSVRVILQTSPDLLLVDADSSQMQQVVMNLILNGAESIDEGTEGSVIVKTDLIQMDADGIGNADLVIGSLIPGPYVVVEVRDTGAGMDKETRAMVFDPFFTTKFAGRGLGLSAVEGILRSHNGALQLQSAAGCGSTFRVYLPASRTPRLDREEPVEHFCAPCAGTILVVDDEGSVRQIAKLGLESHGFQVRVADCGEEAIRILLDKAEGEIVVVLLDLTMPGMSGKQVVERMTALGIRVPVLITSGFSETEVCEEFSDFDIAGFIQKPFTVAQLANRVSSVLHGTQQRLN